jgi:hypothetical protein
VAGRTSAGTALRHAEATADPVRAADLGSEALRRWAAERFRAPVLLWASAEELAERPPPFLLSTRYAALLMIGFVIVATLISHRFWAVPADQAQDQMIHFVKNVAIVGGFLVIFVTGGGRYSLDRWWHHPKPVNVAS